MSAQISFLDSLDVCAPRHGGSETSIAAHERIKASKEDVHNRIMAIVQARGNGITVHEAAKALGYGEAINKVSGRLSELKGRGKLKESGEKRGNACVLVEA